MLAKVLKNPKVADFRPFLVPEMGNEQPASKVVSSFVVPSMTELRNDFVDAEHEPIEDWDTDALLNHARDEADRIIAQAEEHAAIIQQVAADKAAFDATADMASEANGQLTELRLQLTQTIDSVSALSVEIKARAETELVELALQIARRIVGREVTIDREIALTLVKVSLAKLHNRSVAEVHLNPEDFAFVNAHREKLDYRGSLDLVEDRSISPGGCLIHTETGDIDGRIESQFDEISHGLFI